MNKNCLFFLLVFALTLMMFHAAIVRGVPDLHWMCVVLGFASALAVTSFKPPEGQ